MRDPTNWATAMGRAQQSDTCLSAASDRRLREPYRPRNINPSAVFHAPKQQRFSSRMSMARWCVSWKRKQQTVNWCEVRNKTLQPIFGNTSKSIHSGSVDSMETLLP